MNTQNDTEQTKTDTIPDFYVPWFTPTINDRKWEYKNYQQDSMDFTGDWDD